MGRTHPLMIQPVNPISFPEWDEILLATEGASFAHCSAWAKVLSESYGYRPTYFASLDGGRFQALTACMEVRSPFTGRRGVGLPFTDECAPLLGPGKGTGDVSGSLLAFAGEANWRSMEWRGGDAPMEGATPSACFWTHTIDLSVGEASLWKGIRDSTRRNIRKAGSQAMEVSSDTSLHALREFYRLNCTTRRTHGLPPQPWRFFAKLFEHVLSRGLGFVTLARYGGRGIAGAVFFHLGHGALFKYGASDMRFQHLRPSNLVMWEGMTRLVRMGCRTLSLGRTDPQHSGLRQFKNGWGAAEGRIRYYKYDLRRSAFVSGRHLVSGPHNGIFRRLPLALNRLAGSLLYRHLA